MRLFSRLAINHLLFALSKGFLSCWCKGDEYIHGKQVQFFLAFCCLILFAVVVDLLVPCPILLHLGSELLVHALLI